MMTLENIFIDTQYSNIADDNSGGKKSKEVKTEKKGDGRLTDFEYRAEALDDANIKSAANFECPKGKNRSYCPCADANRGKVTCCDAIGPTATRKVEIDLLRRKIFGNFEAHNYKERKEALFALLSSMVVTTGSRRQLQFTLHGVIVCRTYYKVT